MNTRKWVYFLTGLMYPIKSISSEIELTLAESIEDINLPRIGIKLKRIFLTEETRIRKVHESFGYDNRFIFYIKNGIKDDNFAQKFADGVMCSLAVAYNVVKEEVPTAICISEDKIKKNRIIKLQDVIGNNGVGSELYFRATQGIGVPSQVLDFVWQIIPVMIQSSSIMDAANFYRESIMQAWVPDDDVFEIVCQDSDIPFSQTQRAKIETAYQNAFKAIEAIIGEPPKDKKKIRTKLNNAGLDPDEEIGYSLYGMKPGREKFIKKLMDMQKTRDKMAAHGKTTIPRTIDYCELKDKQALAQYVILRHIDMINKSQS
ncbi:MAG: hypothetical protein JXA17_05880 [Dehalococcoidales bacterium]|nr:hypothetical protein [Dehalococcoidales bacterium]